MAIVHVAMKSSSKAPPAAAHADYISRGGRYARRGGIEMLESGNMPEFAQADPRAFWIAADANERANGRTYTELQIALPRELGKEQRKQLALEAAREFLGDRFAYTLAVHQPLAKDNIEQPHMHLMFSERAIDETTRTLPEEKFFKRNGAKKDPAWNDRNKPEEIRDQWCQMMNRAMEREGIAVRVDPRSWADQGREDLAELREPKMLGGDGPEAVERRQEIDRLRQERQKLPERRERAVSEEIGEAQIAEIEQRLKTQLAEIDRRMEVERAKQRAEKAAQRSAREKQEKAQREAIEQRAQQLWEGSPAGRAEMSAAKRYEDDRLQEKTFQRLLDTARKDLADWKAEHPLKALLGNKESARLERDVEYWRIKFNDHQAVFQRSYESVLKHNEIKKASWPELLKQAAEDLRKIVVRLIPEQVRSLIREHFGQNRQAAEDAFQKVDQGSHTIGVLGGMVQVGKDPQEGFVGSLRSMDKPILDAKLTELQRREHAEQQRQRRELESRERNAARSAGANVLSRAELDRQLREIARIKTGKADARIVAGVQLERLEITGRVLGYTSGSEEMLLQRLGSQLVRVPWGDRPKVKIGKEIDIDPRNGEISRGRDRG
jgi:hypothetical protein